MAPKKRKPDSVSRENVMLRQQETETLASNDQQAVGILYV